ncbi:MAG: hypothetical protein ACFB9M_02700 [Myxococcota bacterium]
MSFDRSQVGGNVRVDVHTELDEQRIRSHYRDQIEREASKRLAEVEQLSSWEARDAQRRAVQSKKDEDLARVDLLLEEIKRTLSQEEASSVYREAVRVLGEEGPDAMLAFLARNADRVQAEVNARQKALKHFQAGVEESTKRLHASLRVWLLEADALVKRYAWEEAFERFERVLSEAPDWFDVQFPYQNNLGNALREQGIRTGGAEGAGLLAEAVTAYRNALEVRTRAALPQDWATTQNNLGNALSEQGIRTGGPEGAGLLAEAVTAYRNALEVYTRDALPQDWAMTQSNLRELQRVARAQNANDVANEAGQLVVGTDDEQS